MRIELTINGTVSPSASYFSYAPSPCTIRLAEATGVSAALPVRLQNLRTIGGQVLFYTTRTLPGADTIDLILPLDGTPVAFEAGGKFQAASVADRDAAIAVVSQAGSAQLHAVPCMVRIRKNANKLTNGERDRFVSAMAVLNDRGLGPFKIFRDMHDAAADREIHGNPSFYPWHRAYLLDLERELQNIDPSVALPYWRFDQPADRLFQPEYLGRFNGPGNVLWDPANPLRFWRTDGVTSFGREPRFGNQDTDRPSLRTESQTLAIGAGVFEPFRTTEGDPHGSAHVAWDGPINFPPTAPKDPLFFLLHANVDRLWAKWQWVKRHYDQVTDTYPHLGSAGPGSPERIGRNWDDTMWPWNGASGPPRPPTAPGGGLAASAASPAPATSPILGEMIDYQGKIAGVNRLGFDYDDVPYQPL